MKEVNERFDLQKSMDTRVVGSIVKQLVKRYEEYGEEESGDSDDGEELE